MLSILSFAHVLVGEPASTSPEHALVPLLNPKFANVPAEKSCELRVRGTSRLLKLVFEVVDAQH